MEKKKYIHIYKTEYLSVSLSVCPEPQDGWTFKLLSETRRKLVKMLHISNKLFTRSLEHLEACGFEIVEAQVNF